MLSPTRGILCLFFSVSHLNLWSTYDNSGQFKLSWRVILKVIYHVALMLLIALCCRISVDYHPITPVLSYEVADTVPFSLHVTVRILMQCCMEIGILVLSLSLLVSIIILLLVQILFI